MPDRLTLAQSTTLPPPVESVKVMVPVRALPAVTVAVRVIACPATAAARELVSVVVVLGRLLAVMVKLRSMLVAAR